MKPSDVVTFALFGPVGTAVKIYAESYLHDPWEVKDGHIYVPNGVVEYFSQIESLNEDLAIAEELNDDDMYRAVTTQMLRLLGEMDENGIKSHRNVRVPRQRFGQYVTEYYRMLESAKTAPV